jgi:ATP-binding cassette subfamily B protein/subfamily B ATP-binding cassette protein MsbA
VRAGAGFAGLPNRGRMKNFVRSLRFAWPYRGRLILSVVCALVVALLWGGNFTAIYPLLKILGTDKNLHQWIDQEIDLKTRQIADYQLTLDQREKEVHQVETEWPQATEHERKLRDRRLNELTRLMAKDEYNLSSARSRLHWYQTARLYIFKYLPTDRFETLAWLLVWVVATVVVKGVFDYWQEYLVGNVVNLSLFDLRNRLYRNVIHLDMHQFTDDGTHELMARFTNDMEAMGSGLKTLFGKVVAEPLKAISCVLFACMISWRLTLLFLVLVPVALLFMSKVGTYMKRASRRVLESMSSLYKILQETFQGIKVVKAFTMERYERRRFFMGTKDYYRKGMYVINLDALSGPIMEILGVLAISGALLVGAYLVVTQETHLWGLRMTVDPLDWEALLQLYAFLAAIADPVRKLSNVWNRFQSGAAAADRVFAIMDRRPRVKSNPNAPRLERHHKSIELRDVCFSYDPERPVLTNIRLDVKFGETVAVVGRNGSGKTTLVGLLARFYDPDHGAVLIDGVDIRRVNLRSLRQQTGLVSQETILFDDTLYNNISYGNRHAKPAEVEAAARKAFAHDFIMKTKAGYQTRIGEMGTSLSGGQRQRIALARAILRDPSILILDEATSAADLESEALIQQALRDFIRNRTTFIITHRLSTLEIADRIVVLEGGRIEAVGTHQDLLRTCATYQRLHEVQFVRQAA